MKIPLKDPEVDPCEGLAEARQIEYNLSGFSSVPEFYKERQA
jgi:hypothetical protein